MLSLISVLLLFLIPFVTAQNTTTPTESPIVITSIITFIPSATSTPARPTSAPIASTTPTTPPPSSRTPPPNILPSPTNPPIILPNQPNNNQNQNQSKSGVDLKILIPVIVGVCIILIVLLFAFIKFRKSKKQKQALPISSILVDKFNSLSRDEKKDSEKMENQRPVSDHFPSSAPVSTNSMPPSMIMAVTSAPMMTTIPATMMSAPTNPLPTTPSEEPNVSFPPEITVAEDAQEPLQAVVRTPYIPSGSSPDELTLNSQDAVVIFQYWDDGSAYGMNGSIGQMGYFHMSYVLILGVQPHSRISPSELSKRHSEFVSTQKPEQQKEQQQQEQHHQASLSSNDSQLSYEVQDSHHSQSPENPPRQTIASVYSAVNLPPSTVLFNVEKPEAAAQESVALRAFVATREDEITVKIGDRVRIHSVFNDGWGHGQIVGTEKIGFFPLDALEHPGLEAQLYDSSSLPRQESTKYHHESQDFSRMSVLPPYMNRPTSSISNRSWGMGPGNRISYLGKH